MRLQDLQGTYNSVFSLGRRCLTAIHLEENRLRTFPGIIDWMAAPELSSINYLIKHRFARFMEIENMQVVGKYNQQFIVYDDYSHIYSYHDFFIDDNTEHHLHTYMEFKLKLNKRIERFLACLENDEKVLFVRIQGLYRDVVELQKVLAETVTNDFRVLVVNNGTRNKVVELDWNIDKVCVIEIPNTDVHSFKNAHLWSHALQGIKV